MMVLCSEISIGTFRFTGVHDVHIKRSVHDLTDTAVLKIPAYAAVSKPGRSGAERVVTATKINEGDTVMIKLGYNGVLKTEFRGFVKEKRLSLPLEIICEGYSWLLRRNKPSLPTGKVTLLQALNAAVSGLEGGHTIAVTCDTDITFENLPTEGMSGFDIMTLIQNATDNNLTCFFTAPDTLWCGLMYSQPGSSDNQVQYRNGYNIPDNNTLRPHSTDGRLAKVTYLGQRRKGEARDMGYATSVKGGSEITIPLTHVPTASSLKQLAAEKVAKAAYEGFEGSINTFLQPYAQPGDTARYVNNRYPEMNGTYRIMSTEVSFGQHGARRNVELGPINE